MSMTIFLLAARYDGRPAVELSEIADMFGLGKDEAIKRAGKRTLPVTCFRMADSQKAPWMVRLDDLALHIDQQRDAARNNNERINSF